jgi:hypothetical protein
LELTRDFALSSSCLQKIYASVIFSGPQQPSRNGGQHNPQQQLHHQQQNESILNGNQGGGGGQNTQKVVMRDNLHYAADSVSNAMSSLVRELNSGAILLLNVSCE